MGAGAGYTVFIKNSSVESVGDISNMRLVKDTSGKELFHWCDVECDCDTAITADVKIESYYDGCDWVSDVPLTCTHVNIDLGIGDGYNSQILTDEAIAKYEEMFGIPVNDMYKELIEVIELVDIRTEYLEECIRDSSFDGEARMGGGWTGSTFDGVIEDLDVSNGSGYVTSANLVITNTEVVEFLDLAKYGDNKEYAAYDWNGLLDSFDNVESAINALKTVIDKEIANGDIPDLAECYVEGMYWYLTDTNGDIESGYDDAWLEYTADSDPDYEEYVEE